MKVSELTGPQLDYWVARAEGMKARLGVDKDGYGKFVCGTLRIPPHPDASPWWGIYRPSDNWEQGGPIIEREKICAVWTKANACWSTYPQHDDYDTQLAMHQEGATQLEAAMRCFVASKFGDEVQFPDEMSHE